MVFLISDYLNDEDLSRPLKVLAIRHDVVLVRISDRWERELPKVGLVEIEDPETGDTLVVDTNDPVVRRQYKELRGAQDKVLTRARNQSGVDLIELSTGEPFIRPLLSFLRRKRTRRSRRTG